MFPPPSPTEVTVGTFMIEKPTTFHWGMFSLTIFGLLSHRLLQYLPPTSTL